MSAIRTIALTLACALGAAACGDDRPRNGQQLEADLPAPPLAPPKKKPVPPKAPVAEEAAPEPPTTPAEPPPPEYAFDAVLRVNQLQVKGTHNSYHLRPNPFLSAASDYDMPSLEDQATKFGVRAFELDVHWRNQRFEVFHIEGDANSNCQPLANCIDRLYAWSFAHPGHLPLFVFLELKYDGPADSVFDRLDDLDALLAGRAPSQWIFKPDDFRGSSATLKAALLDHGWPTLGRARGKVIFVLMAPSDIAKHYAHDNTGLAGRIMFPLGGDVTWPHSVVLDCGDMPGAGACIGYAVDLGYVVRTRGDDVPTMGDDYPARFQAALDSGAQLVLTDYPAPYALEGYDTSIPGGTPARCNPRTATPECTPEALENPGRLVLPYP